MTAVDELLRKALLHDQAADLLRQESGDHVREAERHERDAARLREAAAQLEESEK